MANHSIQMLIKEEIQRFLNEGRLEDVIAKYPDLESYLIEDMADQDPSGNLKYLAWQTEMLDYEITKLLAKEEDGAQILFSQEESYLTKNLIELIAKFHTMSERNLLTQKDINQYKSIEHLERNINVAKKRAREIEIEKQGKAEGIRIYEDNDFLVVQPKSEASSCYYGRNSKWCIAQKKSNPFHTTYKDSVFLFVINKKLDRAIPKEFQDMDCEELALNEHRCSKMAFQYDFLESDITAYDAQDNSYEVSFMTDIIRLLDKIDANKVAGVVMDFLEEQEQNIRSSLFKEGYTIQILENQ